MLASALALALALALRLPGLGLGLGLVPPGLVNITAEIISNCGLNKIGR